GISMQWRTLVVLSALALIIGACGDKEAGQTNAEAIEDDVSMGQDVSPPPASNAGADTAPLTVADVERWERGMQAELEAVEEAERSFGQARNAEDTLNAMTAANETATLEAGARAAGVNVERYRFIRRNLSNAVKNLTPL